MPTFNLVEEIGGEYDQDTENDFGEIVFGEIVFAR